MQSTLKASVATLACAAVLAGPALAEDLSGKLVIFSDMHDPAPRATMEKLAADFDAMHPNLEVDLTIINREEYKTQIRNFLAANPPDVANWYAGNRMLPYVKAGLFEDVSDVWDAELSANLASTKLAMTIDDKQWGVPYTYYQWGVYYREDIFNELGLSEPSNWEEFKANCQAVLDSGRKCYSIGTKWLWTAAGWFDYLNLRQNGYEFHMALTNGEIEWTDDRVKDVFARWRELIDMGGFIDNHTAYSWQESVPFFTQGDAAMMVKGNFAVDLYRQGGLGDDQIGFHQFPEITPGVPMAEEAPTDTFHIPSGAQNKEAAKAFLKFVTEAGQQTEANITLGQLPVNKNSSVSDDEFIVEGFELLNNAYALAQFFDRDAPAEMAKVAMEGMQEFMVKPDEIDRILSRLERARKRIY
ncbi:ABC transporter substrate-binding protein [Dinoroseobacter sp. S76]|uniref:ABC transporter substrate-binding protein n=1 Tax=Dinoroseobacter sp. S76 TaxID=3415124 RepID=UPI003C7DAEC4